MSNILSQDPNRAIELYRAKYDWNYTTTKDDRTCQAQKKPGVVSFTRGRMLGGSSSINSMLYVR